MATEASVTKQNKGNGFATVFPGFDSVSAVRLWPTCCFYAGLEQETQGKLHFTFATARDAAGGNRAGDRTERGRRTEIARRLIEVRRVGQVVELRAEFDAFGFADGKTFEHGEVVIDQSGAAQCVAACRAVPVGRGRRKRRDVKPLRARTDQTADRRIAQLIWPTSSEASRRRFSPVERAMPVLVSVMVTLAPAIAAPPASLTLPTNDPVTA